VELTSLVRVALKNLGTGVNDAERDALVMLAAQTLDKVSRMIAAHSSHLFRWRAQYAEIKVIEDWLGAEESRLLSAEVRRRLSGLTSSGSE